MEWLVTARQPADLGSVTQLIDASFIGMITLSLSNPNIAYAEFGSTAPSLSGSSVYSDNFAFTPAPEPHVLAIIAFALLAISGFSLRRRRA